MVNINRSMRQNTTRDTEVRKNSWKPAHDLPVPNPVDGYVFRWVRVAMMGKPDPSNMTKASREGWVPCKAADHPEISSDFAVFGLTTTSDLIEVGGLVLCKNLKETMVDRDRYYAELTQRQAESVDNNLMRENDPRMPLFREGKSKVTFGSGQ